MFLCNCSSKYTKTCSTKYTNKILETLNTKHIVLNANNNIVLNYFALKDVMLHDKAWSFLGCKHYG